VIEVIDLPEALAAVLILRLDFHSTNGAMIDDERVHLTIPPCAPR
jgi:hypothetical protein